MAASKKADEVRPRKERAGNAAKRRRQIIEATVRSIVKNGLGRTTLATVSAEAGLSQGVAVFYFKNKQTLLAEVLRHHYEEYQKHWQKARKAAGEDQVGIATGMFYTPVGGDIMFVETTLMRGKGELVLTGQLGDVMKESIDAASSYVRSIAPSIGVKPPKFDTMDIHVHVPEGATPKDGPSAGIAMATAIISLMTGIAVHKDIAMTGEITLRGRVLPIGGLKEKLLAALRGGVPGTPHRARGPLHRADRAPLRPRHRAHRGQPGHAGLLVLGPHPRCGGGAGGARG